MNTLIGQEAKDFIINAFPDDVDDLISYWNRLPKTSGYFRVGDKWIAFDNGDGNMWVEDFDYENEAKRYCEGENVEAKQYEKH